MRKGVWSLVSVVVFVLGMAAFCNAEEGLVGLWKFDEGKGEIARDSSGKGNDGRIYGASYVEGKEGSALEFYGEGSYVDCGSDESLDVGAGDLTVEAWVKLNSTGAWQDIVDKRLNSGSGNGFDFQINASGKIALEVNDGKYGIARGNKRLLADIWYHVAVSCDRDGDTIFYINGELDAVKDLTARNGNLDTSAPLIIGTVKRCFFNGLIDEVKIYNRALSAEEIKKHLG